MHISNWSNDCVNKGSSLLNSDFKFRMRIHCSLFVVERLQIASEHSHPNLMHSDVLFFIRTKSSRLKSATQDPTSTNSRRVLTDTLVLIYYKDPKYRDFSYPQCTITSKTKHPQYSLTIPAPCHKNWKDQERFYFSDASPTVHDRITCSWFLWHRPTWENQANVFEITGWQVWSSTQ